MGVTRGLPHVLHQRSFEHSRSGQSLYIGTNGYVAPSAHDEDMNFVAGQNLPFVQYVVSLAIVQAVQEEAKKRLKVGILFAALTATLCCFGPIQILLRQSTP